MKNSILIILLIPFLIQTGCKKENGENISQILTSKDWKEQINENDLFPKNKDLYKVTFHINGKFEFYYEQWEYLPGETPTPINFRKDSLFGEYNIRESDTTIEFKSIKFVSQSSLDLKPLIIDSLELFIADWHVINFNTDNLEIKSELPDTTEHLDNYIIEFMDNYEFKVY